MNEPTPETSQPVHAVPQAPQQAPPVLPAHMSHPQPATPVLPASRAAQIAPYFTVAAFIVSAGLNLLITDTTLGLALVQLILVPLLAVAGIVTAIIGLVQTRGGRARGRGSAIGGLIMAVLYVIVWFLATGALLLLGGVIS